MSVLRVRAHALLPLGLLLLAACTQAPQPAAVRVPLGATGARTAQGVPELRNPLSPDAQAQVAGAAAYASYSCAACHGDALEGGMGPSLVNRTWVYGEDDTTLFFLIRDGSKALRAHGYQRRGIEAQQGEMPAYAGLLRDVQIWQLIDFIRARGRSTPR